MHLKPPKKSNRKTLELFKNAFDMFKAPQKHRKLLLKFTKKRKKIKKNTKTKQKYCGKTLKTNNKASQTQ